MVATSNPALGYTIAAMSHANATLSLTASAANLRRLLIIRLILIGCLAAALGYAEQQLDKSGLLHPVHWLVLGFYVLISSLTYWRLQQQWPVSDQEYFGQLCLDLLLISLLLYFSGGASNPFVSFYLVPLCISSAILPWRYTWVIAGLSMLAYSLMLFYFQPLPTTIESHNHHGDNSFNQHILGMWVNFTLSAGLITYFVVKMASALRQQESALAIKHEDELRDEQILAVATLAAGTAHELGTPLATMSILLEEMEQEYRQPPPLNDDIQLLKQQLSNCKQILQGLVSTAESHSHGQRQQVAADLYLKKLLEHWQVTRPDSSYKLHIQQTGAAPLLNVDSTLNQAVCNLLNNAADACHRDIEIALQWQDRQLRITIRDHGPGIALETAEQLGKPFISTKGKGLGLGLFLSHATVNRYGGSIELNNHPEGGCQAQLQLPLDTPG